MILMTAFRRQL